MNPETQISAPPLPAGERKAVGAGRKNILLVDDDPAIRRVLTRLLVEEDYNTSAAANGIEALKLADTTQFDLVLLDLNMPLKDGWETFQQLVSKNPLLPIIVITARANQLFPALASGVAALLEKPLDFTMLFLTIHNLLEEPLSVRLSRITGHQQEFRYAPPTV